MSRNEECHVSEHGAALLSVLLLVAVMSIASIAMLNVSLGVISKARIVDARGQLAWQITGAEEAGLVGVETLRVLSGANINDRTPNFRQTRVTPLPTGVLTTRLEEDSNCFNVNTLGAGGEENEERLLAIAMYEDLLTSLGLGGADVEALQAGLVDWLDGDRSQRLSGAEELYYSRLSPPYRPGNVPVRSVTEVRAVRGYSRDLFLRLRPMICARQSSENSVLNINTLTPEQAPLLVMAFSGELDLNDAVGLIGDRPAGGWGALELFLADERLQAISPELHRVEVLSVQSSFLRLIGQIVLDEEVADFTTIYALPEAQPTRIVRRTYGAS